MYFPLSKLLLFGAIVSRATAQDDDNDGDDLSDDDDGNGFGAVDEGIAQLDTSQVCDTILNQCPGGFPASSCPSHFLLRPFFLGFKQYIDILILIKVCVNNWCSNGCADPYMYMDIPI